MEEEQRIPRAEKVRVFTGNVGEGEHHHLSPNYRAVVDESNPINFFGMVSKDYNLVQHEDYLNKVELAIDRNPEYGKYERTLVFPKNGAVMQAKYRFPDVSVPIDGKNGKDTVNPVVILRNGHNGQINLEMLMGAFQTFCWNGLVIGKKMMQSKIAHTRALNMDRITATLDSSLHMFSEQTKIWQGWVDKLVGYEEYTQITNAMDMNKKDSKEIAGEINKFDEVVDLETLKFEGKTKALTLWAFYSIFTAFITHKVKNDMKRMELDMKVSKAFGKY